jgi:PAS domain S-box-containing protein
VEPASQSSMQQSGEDVAIRYILEGTAAATGSEFFDALVKYLAQALSVAGAWVTEWAEEPKRLRAVSFWFEDGYIRDFEYDIRGTPCEPVIESARLLHIPEHVTDLFPGASAMKDCHAVSYIGVPLFDVDGRIVGNVGVLDTKKLPLESRIETLFRIFAARATAEVQRLRAESEVREREQKLSLLVGSAPDAIIELDNDFTIASINRSACITFGGKPDQIVGRSFYRCLGVDSAKKISRLAEQLRSLPEDRRSLWISGGLTGRRLDGIEFPAEASLAHFEVQRERRYTVILRNVNDRLEADRRIASLISESEYLKEEITELHNFHEMVGAGPAMREVFESIQCVGPTDSTVLIHGETGTGKELVARAIHAASGRAKKPLIKVNCAAIPAALMESEFFGHEKGAFTGATLRREGRFALADGGTIFLDEVGELPFELQPKLLRVLQEGEFELVGSSQTRAVDVRVIAATNRDLRAGIQESKFRADLYYRLNVFPIQVPPLRQRCEDIEPLVTAFIDQLRHRSGREILPPSPEYLGRLRAYDWPGNVRELQNVIERAVITSRDGRLNLDAALPSVPAPATPLREKPEDSDTVRTDAEIRQLERQNIIRALERTNWRVAGPHGAAQLLGLPITTLRSRMKAFGIERH